MIPAVLAALALIFTFGEQFYRKKNPFSWTLLKYLLFFNVGFMGIIGFIAHTFYAEQTAIHIGWAPGSPFQFEIGMANLAFGIVGLLCLRWHGRFWLATALASSVFYLGCAYGHWVEYTKGDVAPLNVGPTIWLNDLVLPLVLLGLAFTYIWQADRR